VAEPIERIRIRRDDDEVKSDFNNTSMTDVIFIFLIFFVSVSQIRTSRVDLKLPEVSGKAAASARDEAQRVVIDVSKENGVFVDGVKVEARDLGARIAALHAGAPDEGPRIRIRSDEESRSGRLVEVIAALADAGLTRIEFAVKVASPEARSR